METERLPLKELIPYRNNAKKHPQYHVDQIKRSIEQFGNIDPIAIDENNMILEGHGRYLALKALGVLEVPVIRIDHLSAEEKKAYILAHNQLTLNTGFDLPILEEELSEIASLDMTDFGFSTRFWERPILDIHSDEADSFRKEEEERVETSVDEGVIYQLGRHRLMCGDATNPEHVAKLLDGKKIDLYLTDPPYNVSYEGKTAEALTIQNDNLSRLAFEAFLCQAFSAVDNHLKAGGAFYIWYADKERLSVSKALESFGWDIKQTLIWVKDHFVLGRQDYQWQHEPCLYGWKGGAKHYFISDFSLTTLFESSQSLFQLTKGELISLIQDYQEEMPTTILREGKPFQNKEHPTMKPIPLMERLIRNSSRQGELVFDSFLGSGSTLLACENLNRRCYGMELDPKYVSVTLKRYEELTGQKPIRLG
ncbi:methyltransferase [Streptococcus canis]|uniref:site-specific DNA-methyltransferase n=2 Tax=Streptococcus canis TaxID=1329 RepID=UPI000B8B4217|nr:site-specific DNA-methyltransferase [Streptococcus canis]MDW7797656.1 site-specific DNA-methyltransferase [Streptococcus canis]QJD13049.1 site-specific DNA-methyltransferase [Streptococcus canis]QKG73391.1 site-specific DNA-methyltransferase [Streptococcus canis]VTR80717.1 DNA methylase [Streptococcus canis]GFE42911.1 methyltransferase [Streptococcus canis]